MKRKTYLTSLFLLSLELVTLPHFTDLMRTNRFTGATETTVIFLQTSRTFSTSLPLLLPRFLIPVVRVSSRTQTA